MNTTMIWLMFSNQWNDDARCRGVNTFTKWRPKVVLNEIWWFFSFKMTDRKELEKVSKRRRATLGATGNDRCWNTSLKMTVVYGATCSVVDDKDALVVRVDALREHPLWYRSLRGEQGNVFVSRFAVGIIHFVVENRKLSRHPTHQM